MKRFVAITGLALLLALTWVPMAHAILPCEDCEFVMGGTCLNTDCPFVGFRTTCQAYLAACGISWQLDEREAFLLSLEAQATKELTEFIGVEEVTK